MHPYVREYFRRLRLLAWNETERRPRALLRVHLFLTAYTIIFISIPILIVPSGTGLLRSAGLRVLLVLSILGLLFTAARVLDHRSIRTFGLRVDRQWVTDSLVGTSIGVAIPTVATLISLAGGWLAVVEPEYIFTVSFLRDIGLAIVVTICIAIVEEIVFRGYILTNAIEGLDIRWLSASITIALAWSISALLFALAHPASSLVHGIHFVGAGSLLGIAYLLTGQLGLPIGIHMGFNFAAGYIFPTTQDPSVAVVPLTVHGPAWLVGQTGVVQTGLQLPAFLAILAYVWWRSGSLGVSPTIKRKIESENWGSESDSGFH